MDVDLYRYFIGRADQSVNEKVMVTRVDQQVRVTKLMIDSHNLKQLYQTQRKLARYMTSYLSMMMTISSIFLIIDGSPAALGKKTELWEYLRTSNPELYHKLKYRSLSFVGNIPGYQAASCPSSSTAWPGRSTSSTERKGNRRHESACSVTTRNANSPKGAGPRSAAPPFCYVSTGSSFMTETS